MSGHAMNLAACSATTITGNAGTGLDDRGHNYGEKPWLTMGKREPVYFIEVGSAAHALKCFGDWGKY